ncbi:hypothetical protein DL93DRAFT_2094355 [Clavulina sp. PMI_390]|nr:hypothetical protein DL93DRAFT_2094355 [Clavulina sp. PMI_390]
MLIKQSELSAVQVAHEALLKSVSLALQSPCFTQVRHVWSTFDIPERKRAVESINSLTAQILECRQQIESFQITLDEIHNLCISTEGALAMCANPIAALPAELVQRVARFVVETPRKAKQITTLAQVSRTWRSIMFDISEHFVAPDWTWNREALEDWISRARGRAIEAHVIVRDGSNEALASLSPYLSRLQCLHLVSEDAESLHQAGWQEMIFQHSMPMMTSINIAGVGNELMYIDPSQTPMLHTLHSVATPIAFGSSEEKSINLRLRNLGWRVHNNADLQNLIDAVSLQTVDFHLTMYAHQNIPLPAPFMLERRHPSCWNHLASLRIHGFVNEDHQFFMSLVHYLDAPNLRSLELVDITLSVLRRFAAELALTNARIERLLIATVDTKGVMKNLLQPFITDNHRDDAKLVAYNIREFVLCDFDESSPNLWELDIISFKAFVKARNGTLKRLVLPSSLQPVPEEVPKVKGSKTTTDDSP